MDIFKEQENRASRAFKTFKDKVIRLYKGETVNEDQTLKPYQLKPKRDK